MSDRSIFPNKENPPTEKDLSAGIGASLSNWKLIQKEVRNRYPEPKEEWNFAGKKFGWSFRMKDKKRAILYFLPRDQHFKVAFVFGQKATDEIMQSNISESIKKELKCAQAFAEGRGIRIDVKNEDIIADILQLIDIKLKH